MRGYRSGTSSNGTFRLAFVAFSATPIFPDPTASASASARASESAVASAASTASSAAFSAPTLTAAGTTAATGCDKITDEGLRHLGSVVTLDLRNCDKITVQ
jgi:hypothetical protein